MILFTKSNYKIELCDENLSQTIISHFESFCIAFDVKLVQYVEF